MSFIGITRFQVTDKLYFSLTTESEILSILRGIKSNSTGIDGITAKMIVLCCPTILPFLCHVVNYSIEHSVFPDVWKCALVTPINKTSNPRQLSHLRPISILPLLSKVCERVIAERLRHHLDLFDILPDCQSGFRAGFSSSTTLLAVTDEILKAIDNKQVTILILLDFSKAFDRIHHETLLAVLHYIGLSEESIQFIQSYLSNRKQSMVLNGQTSGAVDIVSGVPQGSILGPLLYLLSTIGFADAIDYCTPYIYADDTQLLYSFNPYNYETAERNINHDLHKIVQFAAKLCLHINASKSSAMVFGDKSSVEFVKSNLHLVIGDNELVFGDNAKSLGIIIDERLRFCEHVQSLLRKAYATLRLLYNNRYILNQKLKLQLCDALVLSIFNYGDVVYHSCLDSVHSDKIQKLQNSCLRFIYGIRRRDRISHALVWAGWLNMSRRRTLHCLCLYHKIILHKRPPYLYNKIKFRTDVHHINVRHRHALTIPLHRLEMFKRSFSYCVPNMYNRLPDSIKNLGLLSFKGMVKEFLGG